jgi:glyoxylase-like metal-dependent hydrolase (beta-lactamase superfamily II)
VHEVVVSDVVSLVGGGGLSDPSDCLVYVVSLGETVLVDCGVGPSWPRIADNVAAAGCDPRGIHTLLLTHCHVDHIGAAARLVRETACRVVAHDLDADAIESGESRRTAADWYGIELEGVHVGHRMVGDEETLSFSGGEIRLVHTPGHTPGSIAAVIDTEEGRVLFGQDVHGPFSPAFGSDKEAWRASMARLLELEADVLCEGHFGVMRPASEVRRFIEEQVELHSRRP